MQKLLITILSFLFIGVSYADHDNDMGSYHFAQVPALCGTPNAIKKYLDHHKLEPYDIALGREGMEPTGTPVYMMTYWVSEDGHVAATIDVPQGTETCILFHTFDRTKPSKD